MDPSKKIKITDDDYQLDEQEDEEQKIIENHNIEDEINQEELIEEYKSLITYKQKLMQVDELIQAEQDESQLQDLKQIKQEIYEAIQAQEDKIKQTQNNNQYTYCVDILKKEYINRVCKSYFQKEKKWYNAIIIDVDTDEQMADIQFIGYKEAIKQHAIYIKINQNPDPQVFQPGFSCEAIYNDDGKYYPCIIEKIQEDGKYVIKFKKYNNKDVVPIDYLRESRKNYEKIKQKPKFDDLTELKIPESLKILPNDSEQQRQAKKKRKKALKQAFKQEQLSKESHEKQSKWQDFNKSGQQKKIGHFTKSKESIFKSPETIDGKVGVMGSGKGMTNFSIRNKMALDDNSHLSRLF